MDVAGAEALRRRIEENGALGRSSGSAGPAEAGLTSSARDDIFDELDGDEQLGCVRPALRQWLEHHERLQSEPLQTAPPAGAVRELTGGGAGALHARIEQQQRRDGHTGRGRPSHSAAAASVGEILARGRRRRAARWRIATIATSVSLSVAAAALTTIALQRANGEPTPTAAVVHLADWRPVAAALAAPPSLPVTLHALASYNPDGSGPENGAEVPNATDGNAVTYWSTESYLPGGFEKPGTGLLLGAGHPVRLARIELETGTPGFQASVRVGDSRDGGFRADSAWKTVGTRTVFRLRGLRGRYWLIWVRLPGHSGAAHINEVRATT
jgi:hypothetical protein